MKKIISIALLSTMSVAMAHNYNFESLSNITSNNNNTSNNTVSKTTSTNPSAYNMRVSFYDYYINQDKVLNYAYTGNPITAVVSNNIYGKYNSDTNLLESNKSKIIPTYLLDTTKNNVIARYNIGYGHLETRQFAVSPNQSTGGHMLNLASETNFSGTTSREYDYAIAGITALTNSLVQLRYKSNEIEKCIIEKAHNISSIYTHSGVSKVHKQCIDSYGSKYKDRGVTLWTSKGSDNPMQYTNYQFDGVYSDENSKIEPKYQLLYSRITNSTLSFFTEDYSYNDVSTRGFLTLDPKANPLNKYKLYGAIDLGDGSHHTKKFYLSWNKNNDNRTINIWTDMPIDDSSMDDETIYDPYEIRMKIGIGVALKLSAEHGKSNTDIDNCFTNYSGDDIVINRKVAWYDPNKRVFHSKNYDPQVKKAINTIVSNCK